MTGNPWTSLIALDRCIVPSEHSQSDFELGIGRLIVTVRIPHLGMRLADVRVSFHDEHYVVKAPMRLIIAPDGEAARTRDGRAMRGVAFNFESASAGLAFTNAVVDALRATYPAEMAVMLKRSRIGVDAHVEGTH